MTIEQRINRTEKTIKSFPTIDLCVNFLISIGCTWNYEKETQLKEKSIFVYGRYAVLYDPYQLLD